MTIETKPDPNSVPPREPPPTLEEAAALLTDPRVIVELAYHGRSCRTSDELAARLEQSAVVRDRASDGFAERKRYDLAAGERERAAVLRRRAKALRVLEAHRQELRKRAEQPPAEAP